MELNGSTDFPLPPEQLAQALRDPEMLRQMIPGCVAVTRTSDTAYHARIEKAAGPVTFRMTADLDIEPLAEHRFQLRAKGRNALAGTVAAVLVLDLAPIATGTRLTHGGHLTATGLAGRMLSSREEMLSRRTEGMFRHLRQILADKAPPAA